MNNKVIDESSFGMHQQQSCWFASNTNIKKSFKMTNKAGVIRADTLINLAPKQMQIKNHDYNNSGGEAVFIETKVRTALQCLEMSDYDIWCQSALWLKSAYMDEAKSLWLEFSKPGKYNPEQFWESLIPRMSSGAGEGVLFSNARDAAVKTINKARQSSCWCERGKSALSYLKSFHPQTFKSVVGETL